MRDVGALAISSSRLRLLLTAGVHVLCVTLDFQKFNAIKFAPNKRHDHINTALSKFVVGECMNAAKFYLGKGKCFGFSDFRFDQQ